MVFPHFQPGAGGVSTSTDRIGLAAARGCPGPARPWRPASVSRAPGSPVRAGRARVGPGEEAALAGGADHEGGRV